MIGVGLAELGVEEYVEGKFWDGELYIDSKKESYKALGFKRMGFFGAFSSVLGKKGRDAHSKAKEQQISGDMKGDAMQNGGTIIVAPGDKVLLSYYQDAPSDHVPLADVLKALGIEGGPPEGAAAAPAATECTATGQC